MVDVIQCVLDCGRFAISDEHSKKCDAHYSAFFCHQLDGFIGFCSRLLWNKRAAGGVGNNNGIGGTVNAIQCRCFATVGDIDQHTDIVHSLDDGRTVVA